MTWLWPCSSRLLLHRVGLSLSCNRLVIACVWVFRLQDTADWTGCSDHLCVYTGLVSNWSGMMLRIPFSSVFQNSVSLHLNLKLGITPLTRTKTSHFVLDDKAWFSTCIWWTPLICPGSLLRDTLPTKLNSGSFSRLLSLSLRTSLQFPSSPTFLIHLGHTARDSVSFFTKSMLLLH